MSDRTVKNGIDYVRNFLGELDSAKLKEGGLIESFNLAKDRVQADTMAVGLKEYVKTAFLSGGTVSVPDDLLVAPNSIIDVGVSSGVKASITVSYTTPTANVTYTANEPGTSGNSIGITQDANTVTEITVSVTFSAGNPTIIVDYPFPDATCQEIIDAVNAHPIASLYVTASTTTPAAVPVPSQGFGDTLENGTGAGFIPCDELSIEDFARTPNNTYQAPSATQPFYVRKGSPGGQVLQFAPSTVAYSSVIYKYRLENVSATTDTIPVPSEYLDLLYKDVLARCYMQLKAQSESQQEAVEYEKKAIELQKSYTSSLQAEIGEKDRMQSNDNK